MSLLSSQLRDDAAAQSKRQMLQDFKLYAVTDLQSADQSNIKKIEAAYQGGADIVQLRSKVLTDAEFYRLGVKVRKIADSLNKLLFVNDRLDLALAIQADGIHLGQDDMPVRVAREIAKKQDADFFIGKSTHSEAQAREAQSEPIDYFGVGPIFGTPTKPTYQPVGIELIKKVSSFATIPFVAIGGIDETNLHEVLAAGAKRIAVVRAIFYAENVKEAAGRLREKIG